MVKNILLWVVIAVVLMSVFNSFGPKVAPSAQMSYSQFLQEAKQGRIAQVSIDGRAIQGRTGSGERFTTYSPETDNSAMIGELLNHGVDIEGQPPEKQGLLMQIFISWFPMLLLIGIWVFFLRQMQGGGAGRGAMSFGKSRARMMSEDQIKVTFADVAGVDEAKEELREIIEFLGDPKKFQKLGGRIPKGVILLGPPGTGKTLLAKAVAGEAGVPFFSMSGSDFVEMFVGVGASRVRDLFDKGKKHAPCILFIDELDAVGRHRGAGLGGGHDEREQTLNQLLVEMDGFETNEGVILLAATNRPDVLDPALLRPGRFDRRIVVDMPDLRGRLGIFKVHTRKVPLAEDVDLDTLARGTPGFSGADIANMVNEAALLAARRNRDKVMMEDFDESKDKVMLGPERKSHIMKEDERRMSAYHEAGHAIVGTHLEHADPLHKVSIIPRGRTGGVTSFLPTDDRHEVSREWCIDFITISLGGRVAEELVLNRIGTGAQEDIRQASRLVRKMVMQWGMSRKMGPIAYGDHDEQIFLGKEIAVRRDYSEDTAREIDNEVRTLMNECHERARHVIAEHKEDLHKVANALLERESLDAEDIKILLNDGTLPPLKKNSTNNGDAAKPAADAGEPGGQALA